MKKEFFSMLISVFMASSANADIIQPTAVISQEYVFNSAVDTINNDRMIIAVNDGDTLASALTATHEYGGTYDGSFVTTDPGGYPSDFFASLPGGDTDVDIIYDLTGGGNTNIGSVIFWQYENSGGGDARAGNAARTIEIRVNTEAEGSTTFSGSPTIVMMIPVIDGDSDPDNDLGGVNSAQFFYLDSLENGRYVQLSIMDNYYGLQGMIAGGDRVGLGEVRFATEGPLPTTEPTNPVPGNGEEDLPVVTDADPATSSDTTLSWTAPMAYTPAGYDVWFGTESNMIKIKEYASFTGTAVDPLIYYTTDFGQGWYDPGKTKLEYETTYHWYVVAYEGDTPHTSSPWRFSTESPGVMEPTDPIPGNDENNLPVVTDADPGTSSATTISWTAPTAYTPAGYDVWFGTESNMIKIKQYTSFTGTAVDPLIYYTTDFGQGWYDPGKTKLEYETTYHWYVVAYEGDTPHASAPWRFSTEQPGVVDIRCSGFYLGDINSNCRVGLADLEILLSNWLEDSSCSGYDCGDLDENGEVNIFDFSILANQWQQEVTVVINEFLASNDNETTGLKDEDGTTSDWIELRNYASYSINLDGWYLTDNDDDLDKWRIPAITLAPGEFRIIFASGKDRSDPGSELHTNFYLDIVGEYLALVRPDRQTVAYKYSDVPIQYEDVSFGLAIRENEHLLTGNYFLSPTPNDVNGTAYPNLGPIISNVIHSPQRPADSDDLVVTAQITERQKPVASVQLIYRVMFGTETTISMVDDGSGADVTGGDGIYTAVIPAGAFSPGEMVRYAIQTEDSSGGQNQLPLVLDLIGTSQSPEYFGTVVSDPGVTSDLPIMEWFTTNPSASHTRTGARASVYYQGRFYDNMYVRQRGQATNAYSQKFNFNKGYDFYINEKLDEVGEVNMNAQGADPAYIRQSLAFNTYEWCGTLSCESFLVLMQLNDSFDRVGVLIEQVDEDFLQRYGRNTDGALYKFVQRSAETESTTDPRFYPYLPHTPCFSDTDNGIEKKTREWEDFSDLQAVVDGLLAPTEEERKRYVFDNFNLPEMISYLAGRAIANDCDDTRKNFYFYRDTNGTGEWEIYPWDNDFTFGIYGDGGPYRDHPFFGDEEHLKTDTLQWNVYFDVMFKLPRTRAMYLRHLRTMMDELLQPPETQADELKFEAICDEMAQPVIPHVNISSAVDGVKNFFPSRRYELYVKYGPGGTEPLIPDSLQGSTEFIVTDTLISGEPNVTLAEYFVPSDDSLGRTWTERTFSGSWDTGYTGIGYERNPGDAVNYSDLIKTDINSLMSNRTSVYIRIPFTVSDPADYDALLLRMKFDDGYIAYINGVELPPRYLEGEGDPVWDSDANGDRGDSICREYEENIISSSMLVAGTNVLAIQGLNNSASSSDLLILPELKGGVNTIINPVILDVNIDQIEYNPASGIQDQEFIQIVNNNPEIAIDVSGWHLSGGVNFTFQPGTVIPTGSMMYVSPNVRAFRERTVSPKGNEGNFVVGPYKGHLSNWGETVYLKDTNQTLVDTFSYPPDPSDAQRYLRITEIMYHPAQGGSFDKEEYEYIELKNIGTGSLSLNGVKFSEGVGFAFENGTSIPAGEYRLLVKNQTAFESRYSDLSSKILGQYMGSLDSGGENIKLEDPTNSTILEFEYEDGWYTITDGLGYSLTIRDPNSTDLDDWDRESGWRASFANGGSPGEDDFGFVLPADAVIVNELLAHADTLEPNDWVEFYNTTDEPINIGGWFISDDGADLMKYEIEESFIIPAYGYAVFYADPNFGPGSSDPGSLTGFAFSENGERIYVTSGSGGEITGVYSTDRKFDPSEADVAFGHYVKSTGGDDFVAMSSNTPGWENTGPKIGPIVITEIAYHPFSDSNAEYVELYNNSGASVQLYDDDKGEPWRFVDDPDDPGLEFYFPEGSPITLADGEYLLLVKDEAAFEEVFLDNDPISTLGVQWLAWGIGNGSLSNGGEQAELQMPGDLDGGVRKYIRVDRVTYDDEAPWPTEPDGGPDHDDGSDDYVLERMDAPEYAAYGNDVINWQAAGPTPGTINNTNP